MSLSPQLQVAGFHLRTGGEFPNGAAAHDPEPRLSCDLVHAAALLQGSFNARGARLVPELD